MILNKRVALRTPEEQAEVERIARALGPKFIHGGANKSPYFVNSTAQKAVAFQRKRMIRQIRRAVKRAADAGH